MRLGGAEDVHLTYCTNVHPSATLGQVLHSLKTETAAVKQIVCAEASMGVGLRLSAEATAALENEAQMVQLQETLAEAGMYVFTLNGFPYGPFHGEAVKARVYEPDWTTPERAQYTANLRRALLKLLPPGQVGSISTSPGGFRALRGRRSAEAQIAQAWLMEAVALARAEERTGQRLLLAVEPEPSCLLETTQELIEFFSGPLTDRAIERAVAQHSGASVAQVQQARSRHLGICLDTCHAAVEFEQPEQCVRHLQQADIPIAKIQLSSGLRVTELSPQAFAELEQFEDPTYLHQVVVSQGAELRRYVDLPEALFKERAGSASPAGSSTEWRIHFHVPIFRQDFGALTSTQDWLRTLLQLQQGTPLSQHLEVETYTWGVLPARFQQERLSDAIGRELRWAQEQLQP